MEILLVIHFIDSQKAFDCLHRDGRLNIMRSHSIPVKLNLNIIKLFYRVLRVLSLIINGPTSDCFITGVKQDCVSMSGFLS